MIQITILFCVDILASLPFTISMPHNELSCAEKMLISNKYAINITKADIVDINYTVIF